VSTTTKTGLDRISVVCVPASDQDASVDFYVNQLGFQKRVDTPFGDGYRWIEVYPPNGTAGIALAPPRPGEAVTPTMTGIALVSQDIDATHAELKAVGVDIDAEVSRMGDPVPPLCWFRDPDGHTLMIVEQD
jgi:catechol 2,3-dioxygenase-like lactoylglutathione lyase family enzyme